MTQRGAARSAADSSTPPQVGIMGWDGKLTYGELPQLLPSQCRQRRTECWRMCALRRSAWRVWEAQGHESPLRPQEPPETQQALGGFLWDAAQGALVLPARVARAWPVLGVCWVCAGCVLRAVAAAFFQARPLTPPSPDGWCRWWAAVCTMEASHLTA